MDVRQWRSSPAGPLSPGPDGTVSTAPQEIVVRVIAFGRTSERRAILVISLEGVKRFLLRANSFYRFHPASVSWGRSQTQLRRSRTQQRESQCRD